MTPAVTQARPVSHSDSRISGKVERAGHEFVARGDGMSWAGVECRRCGGDPGRFYVGRGEFAPCPAEL